MGKLVLGNRIDGGSPTRGVLRMFRYGKRLLSSYEYDTLDLTKLGGTNPGEHHVVDEVERFFERESDPRMTTGAVMFAPMDAEDYQKYFYKDDAEPMLTDFSMAPYRTWGQQDEAQESIALQFRLTQLDHDTVAYLDNSRFMVSNILWEFSPDGGRGKWYQLYELPNRRNSRITLQEPTNQIRLRAVSNNPDEWVQALAVSPKVDWRNRWIEALAWEGGTGEISRDDFGYLSWTEAHGGRGDVIYELCAQHEEEREYEVVVEEIVETGEIIYGDSIPFTLFGYAEDDEYKIARTDAILLNGAKRVAVIGDPQVLNNVSKITMTTWTDDGMETIEYEASRLEAKTYLFTNYESSYVLINVCSKSSYDDADIFFSTMRLKYYEAEVEVVERIETRTETIVVTESLAKTKRNDLAPDEYELPEGFSGELCVTASDALSTIVSEPYEVEPI